MSSQVFAVLVSFLCYQSIVNAFQDCPLLGAAYPAPTNLASSPAIQNAIAALEAAIHSAIATGTLETNYTTFSVEIFSAKDPISFFEFHSAAPVLDTQSVDSNSIYRIGSISKLFTVYLFLIEAGDIHFNEPVTKYVPELAAVAAKAKDDSVSFVDWDHVTIGNLASQLSGIGRDCKAFTRMKNFTLIGTDTTFGELLQGLPPGADASSFAVYGLPPLNASEYPPCSFPDICDRQRK
jgi:CubicO group peptidase (beta-lactamase class C family)